jgi:uncharacterized protein YkwD
MPASSPSGPSSTPTSSAPKASPPASADPAASSSAARPTSQDADAVLDLVNTARDDAGCGELTRDDDLAAAARDNSAAMAEQGSPAVVTDEGTAAAVAAGRPDAGAVVNAWLADGTDRAALLDCSLDTAGVGVADADGGPWWTLLLD